MKRILALLLAISLLLCGCDLLAGMNPAKVPQGGLGTDRSVYPVYENLTDAEKALWAEVITAVENHSTDKIFVGSYATKAETDNAKDRLNHFMRELSFSCPDYFWLNPYSFKIHTSESTGYHELKLELEYILTAPEVAAKRPLYDAKVNEIVTAAKAIPDQFDRVLYVYDTIMAGAKYDHALADSDDTTDLGRSAYGCLVDGETICSGYAMAFRSIMEKLDVECGVEFNSYSSYNISSDGHVWNWCKLDGEYYYFDLTWDDTGFDGEEYRDILPYSHLYFGITADELGSSTYDIDAHAPTPECNGTAYNYFIHEKLSFAEYDYNAVKPAIQAHKNENSVTLRFDSYFELEQAVEDLITNQKIFQILPSLNTISYVTCKTDHHLMLIF